MTTSLHRRGTAVVAAILLASALSILTYLNGSCRSARPSWGGDGGHEWTRHAARRYRGPGRGGSQRHSSPAPPVEAAWRSLRSSP